MRWIVSRTRASQSPSGHASSTCSIPASWESSSAHGTTSTQRASATIGRSRYQRLRVQGRNGFVVVIVQLAPEEPRSPEPFCGMQAWKDDYPWLHRAVKEIGPGARGASDSWRVRIEDELKTTLDFKVRPDGTAAVWCGMSGYDFHHDPTPKELFEGLRRGLSTGAQARRRQQSVEDERRASGPARMDEAASPGSGFAAVRGGLANPNIEGRTPASPGAAHTDLPRGDGTHPRLVFCSERSSLTPRAADAQGSFRNTGPGERPTARAETSERLGRAASLRRRRTPRSGGTRSRTPLGS